MTWEKIRKSGAAAADPFTLNEAKNHARIDHTDDDALVDRLINQAVGFIEGPNGYAISLREQAYKMYMEAFPSEIDIPLHPVKSVDSITYELSGTQTFSSTLYEVDAICGRVRLLSGESWPSIDTVYNPITVNFTVGYDTLPEELKGAVYMLVAHWYDHPEAAAGSMLEIPFGVSAILEQHRRARFG